MDDQVEALIDRLVEKINHFGCTYYGRIMKEQQGKNIVAWGGATFVSSLMNNGLVDEVRLMVNPIILGGGKALFKDVKST